jgi:hypothetical protein
MVTEVLDSLTEKYRNSKRRMETAINYFEGIHKISGTIIEKDEHD